MDPLRHLIEAADADRESHVACPFDLRVERMPAMLNCELADHPLYDGLELQRWDDPEQGTGMLAFLSRRADRRVDLYVEPGLRPDLDALAIGGGIGAVTETTFEVARLLIAPDGVDAHVRFGDVGGRTVEVRIDDRNGRRRRRGSLLAPVSAGIEQPRSLLLVWMPAFDLVHVGGAPPLVAFDGVPASIGSLPGRGLHRRHLIKYAADLVVATLNRQHDATASMVDPSAPDGVELGADARSITSVTAHHGLHRARLALDPPLPDVRSVQPAQRQAGVWSVSVDDAELTGGTWEVSGDPDKVRLALDVTRRWRPTGLPLLMRIVTRVVPTFRQWPTTYRWRATASRSTPPLLRSRWERTGDADGGDADRGDAYRRATGSAARAGATTGG